MRLRRLAVTLAACCLQVRPAAADESIRSFGKRLGENNLQMKPPWQADDGSTQEAVDARGPISPLNFNIHTIKLITRRATRHVLPI